jgi:hypothetical protein
VFFAGDGSPPQSFTANQATNVGGFTVDATACAGIATVAPPAGTTFTVTPVAVGVCKLIVTSVSGGSAPIYASVTAGKVNINAKRRR